jgi:7-carboxy-7-deazaguanine synthase
VTWGHRQQAERAARLGRPSAAVLRSAHLSVIASVPLSLPVVETFHSLQGEGLHAGRSAFFIRLAGCTVGCSWCDTKHSWPAAVHPHRTLNELTAEARQAAAAGAAFVVITGGEPLHHDLDGLCTALRQASHSEGGKGADGGLPAGQAQQTGVALPMPLHLESSGVDPLSGQFDWITLSPKRHRPPSEPMLAACHELKVVVEGEADLAFAEAMAGRALALRRQAGGPPALLLQPAWEHPDAQPLAIAYVRSHPAWRLSLQSHKWLGVR